MDAAYARARNTIMLLYGKASLGISEKSGKASRSHGKASRRGFFRETPTEAHRTGVPPNRGFPMALNYFCLSSFITCFFIKNIIYLRLEKGDYTFPQFTSQDVFFETRDGFPKNGFRRSPERSAPNLTISAGIILFFPPVRGRRDTPAAPPTSGKKADPRVVRAFRPSEVGTTPTRGAGRERG